ncbi:MAG: reverse transcriptase family protein, partial [Legionellales bacterium]|nr:reverse transcriptase family protein [Legionellales bacterium]
MKNPNEHSLFLNETDPGEIYDLLRKLDTKKASDIFGISPKLIQMAAHPLSNILAPIFNKSFQLGQFPDKMKVAKVIPIHKADSKMVSSNYRPISLLSIISKKIEKVMYSRIINFLKKYNILFKHQYGFQQNKSTEHAVLGILSKIIEAFENKENPCCIFLDFAKAFDTVNHDILLNKLYYYGIRGNILSWFESYLKERKQCVQVGNSISDLELVTCGVPQGSVLGPLLFLIYINDIPNSSKVLYFHLFADDTSLFLSHKDINKLEELLNHELDNISNWLKANKLSLNVSKSNVLIFRAKNASNDNVIHLNIDNEPLLEKTYAKYLGVYIDHKLTWETHINHIKSKLIKGNAILAKLRHFMPENIVKNVYNSYIQPHIDYGALTWGGCAQTHIDKLQVMQNNALRLIEFVSDYRDHATPLYVKLKLLKVKDSIIKRSL